jgi:hypothetical protein
MSSSYLSGRGYYQQEAPFWLKINAFYSVLGWLYNFHRWPIMFLDPDIRCFTHAWTFSARDSEENSVDPQPIVVIITSDEDQPMDVPGLLPSARVSIFEKSPYYSSFAPLIAECMKEKYRVVMFSLPDKFDEKNGLNAIKFVEFVLARLTEYNIPNWYENEINYGAIRFVVSGKVGIKLLEGSKKYSKSYLGVCTPLQYQSLAHCSKKKMAFYKHDISDIATWFRYDLYQQLLNLSPSG